MNRRPDLIAVLLLATLFVLPGCGSEPEAPDIPVDPGVEFVTESGLRVRLLPDPGSGLFASNVFVGAGSTREDDATAGSSHFLEHLLFNGTERRTQEELYAEVDRIGGYNNATTRREYTHFMMVAPSEEFDAALDIQADMLLHSILPEEKFEKERGIVLEEMSKDEDDPAYQRRRALTEVLFGDNPDFARPVLGTRASIAALERARVLDYYRRQYVPSNMRLLLMGDFDLAEARTRIEELFAGEPGDARPAPSYRPAETSVLHTRKVQDDAITVQVQLPAPEVGHDDFAAIGLVVDALGNGDGSRLSRALEAEPSLAPLEIGAGLDHLEGASLLRITARLPLDADPEEALRRILAELATVAETGLRASEWSQARNRALSASIREVEQLHYYALLQGDRIWHGPPGYERRLQRQIESSYSNVAPAARRWFAEPTLTVAMAGPDLVDADAPFDPVERGYAPRADAEGGSPLPGGGVLDDERPLATEVQPPSVTVLNNGMTVIHSASPSTRMFAMHLLVRDRSAREPEGMAGIADLLHRVLPQGAAHYDREEFAALLAGIGAEWKVTDAGFIPYDDYYGTDNRFSFVRLDCVDLYWKEAIRLLSLMLGEPRLEQEAIDRAREEMLMRIRQDGGRPSTVAARVYEEELLGPEHPYTRPVFGTEESLRRITREDLQRFALDYLDPGQLVLAVVGNLDRQAVVDQLEAQLDIGGSSDHVVATVPALPVTEEDQRETIEVGGSQVGLRIGRVVELAPEDRWALEVAVGIASQRMQQDLRETRGWAYSLGISMSVDGDRARITASMGTQPQNAEAAEQAVREVLTAPTLQTDADEIAAVVNRRLGRERMRRVTSIGKAYNLCTDLTFGGGLDFASRRSQGLRSVTPEAVTRAWERHLGPGPLVTSVAR